MRAPLLYSLLILGLVLASCQEARNLGPDPADVFVKYYGGGFDQEAVSLIKEASAFTLLGNTQLNSLSEIPKAILIWTDEGGNEIASRTVEPQANYDFSLSTAMRLQNETYYLAGTAYKGTNSDIWVTVQDKSGSRVLANDFLFGSPSFQEEAADLESLADGSFLLLGTTSDIDTNKLEGLPPTNDSSDILLLKVSQNGDELWQKKMGYSGTDIGLKLHSLGDENFILLGNSRIAGRNEIFLALVNSDGNVFNTRNLNPGTNNRAIGLSHHGGFIYVSGAVDGRSYLAKLDLQLNVDWEYSLGLPSSSFGAAEINSVAVTDEGNLLLSASVFQQEKGLQAVAHMIDAAGKDLWPEALFFGANEDDRAVKALAVGPDRNLLLGSFGFGSNRMIGLLKFSASGLRQ